MRRTIRIKLDCLVTIDGPGEGLPHIPSATTLLADGLARQLREGTEAIIHPGGRLSLSITKDPTPRHPIAAALHKQPNKTLATIGRR